MPQNNDVIDLTKLPEIDNQVIGGEMIGCELVLHMEDGTNIVIDMCEQLAEYGGIKYDNTHAYVAGDMVSDAGIGYIAIAPSTGMLPAEQPTYWIRITDIQWNGAGAAWDSEREYLLGDLVTVNEKVYVALAPSVGVDPTTNDTVWLSVEGSYDGQGAKWDNYRIYEMGDIVTDGEVPSHAFISLVNNNQAALPIDGTTNQYWQTVTSVYYNATTGGVPNDNGLHNPDTIATSGTEYPDTSQEDAGAIWYITGLGYTGVEQNEYTFQNGALAGLSVVDNDKITWVDGANGGTPGDGSEVWHYTPFPKVDGERAGLKWNNTYSYLIGDTVTHNEVLYLAVQDNTDVDPETDHAIWKSAAGGPWNVTLHYTEGQIVSYNGDIYIAGPGGVAPGTNPGTGGNWILATPDEKGGILHSPTTEYVIGDVVSYDEIVYMALQDNTNTLPDSDALIWRIVGGAGSFDTERPYLEGEIISQGGDLWIAPPGGVPAGPFDSSLWIAATKEGDLWVANVNYDIGDIVSFGGIVYVSNTANIDSQPAVGNADWHMHVAHDTYAAETVGGTVKARWDGATNSLYLTNNGTNP